MYLNTLFKGRVINKKVQKKTKYFFFFATIILFSPPKKSRSCKPTSHLDPAVTVIQQVCSESVT